MGTKSAAAQLNCDNQGEETQMRSIIYLVGLVVIVLAIVQFVL